MRAMLILIVSLLLVSSGWGQAHWPEFRGPAHNGHAASADLPVSWSETANVKWKVPVHGRGWSTPVIWGDQIWLTTAAEDGKTMSAMCVSLASGEMIHGIIVFKNKKPARINETNTYASPSPLIEERRFYRVTALCRRPDLLPG